MQIYLEKGTHSSQFDTERKKQAGSLSPGLQLPISRYSLCGHRATYEVLQELFPSHSFSIFKNPPALVSMFSICEPSTIQRLITKTQIDFKEPVWKRRARSWGGQRQLYRLETLMAALNIHCCRWVWIWMDSLINECKLRTKQPKEAKTHSVSQCTPATALGGIPTH